MPKKKSSNLQVNKKDPYRGFTMTIEGVGGLNTAVAANAIDDNECQALWNYVYIGKNLVRKIKGPLLYATLTKNIQAFYNDVINNILTMFVILSDGSAGTVTNGVYTQAVNAPAGTFNTTGATIDITNWQNEQFLITDATNGYFLLAYLGTQIITNGSFTTDLTGWESGNGTDIVTNGTFATDLTGWTGTNWSWSGTNGGEALYSGSGAHAISQAGAAPGAGMKYIVHYTVSGYTGGHITCSCGGVSDTARTANGNYVFRFTAINTNALTFTPTANVVAIQNVTMYDTDWSWDSGNGGQALFDGADVDTLNQPAAAPTIGVAYTLIYEITQLAIANIVTNGNFASNITGWTGSNWAWNAANGGEALFSGTGTAALTQSAATVTVGDTYNVTFTVTDLTGGSVVCSCGGVNDVPRTADGTYTFTFTATSTTALAFTPTANSMAIQNVVMSIAGSGSIVVSCGGVTDTPRTAVGTYYFGFTAATTAPVAFTPTSNVIGVKNVALYPTSGSGLVPTVILLSASLNGQAIAIWQGRVLLAQGRILNYSGPLDYTFQPGSGSGTFNITSTNLRQQIERVIPYMDSVYVIGDHAIVALTGTTISSDPTTWYQMEMFNTLGSIYPPAVVNFQNNIYAPNEYGVFRIASTQSVKVDVMLDNTQFTFQSLRADVSQINNLNFYMAVAYAYSPVSNSNRKFIIAYCLELQQWTFLDFGFDVDGIFTTRTITDHSIYVWSGAQIYKLFAGSGAITTYLVSKVFDMGDPYVFKSIRYVTIDYKVYSGVPDFAVSLQESTVDQIGG